MTGDSRRSLTMIRDARSMMEVRGPNGTALASFVIATPVQNRSACSGSQEGKVRLAVKHPVSRTKPHC